MTDLQSELLWILWKKRYDGTPQSAKDLASALQDPNPSKVEDSLIQVAKSSELLNTSRRRSLWSESDELLFAMKTKCAVTEPDVAGLLLAVHNSYEGQHFGVIQKRLSRSRGLRHKFGVLGEARSLLFLREPLIRGI